MEPQFQTSSFIPKKPIDTGIKMTNAQEPVSIFSVVAWLLLVVTIVVSVGLFVYKGMLQSQISQAQTNVVSAKEAFQPDTIQQLVNLNNQISAAEKLLNSHVLVSNLFGILQNLTVKKVSFADLSYTSNNGKPTIAMSGESQSYNALVEQSSIFTQSGSILTPEFSNLTLAQDGNISFKFSANVDPGVLSYKKVIDSNTN